MRTGRVGSTGSRGKAAAYATSDARRTSWDQWYFFRNYLFTPKEAEFNLDHSPLYCQYYPLRRTHLRCRSMLNYVHTHSDHHPLHTRFTFVTFFWPPLLIKPQCDSRAFYVLLPVSIYSYSRHTFLLVLLLFFIFSFYFFLLNNGHAGARVPFYLHFFRSFDFIE